MKKINKIIFVGLLAVLMGCNDAIDITQPGRLDAANAFNNVEDLQLGLLGVYNQWDLTPEIALASNFTDEVTIGFDSGGQGQALYGFQLNPASAAASNFWVRNFRFNNRATILIEAAANVTVDPADQAEFNNTAKVATIARKIEASEKTIDDVFNAKSKFEIAAETTEFNDLAKEKGLTVRASTFKELEENIPGLGSQRQVVRWAYEGDTKVGDYKSFPISGVGFIVAKLVDINKEGLMSVENATTPVLVEVRKEKKAEMIRAKISASTLADIANNQGQTVRTAAALTEKNTTLSGAGIEPKVVGAAFGLTQGAISKPIDGERGVYILQVNKITEAPKLENYAAIIARLGNALKNTVQNKVYTALEAAAEIDDNRAKTVY